MKKRGLDSKMNEAEYYEQGIERSKEGMKNQQYVKDVLLSLEAGLSDTFDRETILAGAMKRKLNTPGEVTSGDLLRGTWKGNEFVLNDNFVPKNIKNANPEHLTVGQIKDKLSEKYGIELAGIPYHDGVADFRSISIANISTEEMFRTITGMSHRDYAILGPKERAEKFASVFSRERRERNFSVADRIVSEKHIQIPGLPDGYTKEQLTEWRSENKFSWDEQLNGGYSLVPAVIHQNISHTGLVSTAGNAYKNLNKRADEMAENPEIYYWNDLDAPISFDEVRNYRRLMEKRCKGGGNMTLRKGLGREINSGRRGEISYDEIDKEAGDQVLEGDRLGVLAKQFVSDKNKLEDEIERVQEAEIPNKDKTEIIEQLNAAIEKLQEQYGRDVVEEERKVQKELENQIEFMQETANELEKQEASLRSVQMGAASTDASAAADAAEEQKMAFKALESEYVEKLKRQMEQAEIQKKNIRNRRFEGDDL